MQGREVVWSDVAAGQAVCACGTPCFAAVGMQDGSVLVSGPAALWRCAMCLPALLEPCHGKLQQIAGRGDGWQTPDIGIVPLTMLSCRNGSERLRCRYGRKTSTLPARLPGYPSGCPALSCLFAKLPT